MWERLKAPSSPTATLLHASRGLFPKKTVSASAVSLQTSNNGHHSSTLLTIGKYCDVYYIYIYIYIMYVYKHVLTLCVCVCQKKTYVVISISSMIYISSHALLPHACQALWRAEGHRGRSYVEESWRRSLQVAWIPNMSRNGSDIKQIYIYIYICIDASGLWNPEGGINGHDYFRKIRCLFFQQKCAEGWQTRICSIITRWLSTAKCWLICVDPLWQDLLYLQKNSPQKKTLKLRRHILNKYPRKHRF